MALDLLAMHPVLLLLIQQILACCSIAYLLFQIQILYSRLFLFYSMQVTIMTASFITNGDFLFLQWQLCLTFSCVL